MEYITDKMINEQLNKVLVNAVEKHMNGELPDDEINHQIGFLYYEYEDGLDGWGSKFQKFRKKVKKTVRKVVRKTTPKPLRKVVDKVFKLEDKALKIGNKVMKKVGPIVLVAVAIYFGGPAALAAIKGMSASAVAAAKGLAASVGKKLAMAAAAKKLTGGSGKVSREEAIEAMSVEAPSEAIQNELMTEAALPLMQDQMKKEGFNFSSDDAMGLMKMVLKQQQQKIANKLPPNYSNPPSQQTRMPAPMYPAPVKYIQSPPIVKGDVKKIDDGGLDIKKIATIGIPLIALLALKG